MTSTHRRVSTLCGQLLALSPRSCSAVADKISFEPLPGLSFGARVHGCQVDTDMEDPEARAKFWAALLEYGLLVFPVQKNPDGSLLTREQQVKFVSRFGTVDHEALVTNIRKNGEQVEDQFGSVLHSTEGFHSDATYLKLAVKTGCIFAEVMPETGGETQIADMCGGYDALDEVTKARIAELKCFHSLEVANGRRSGTFPKNGRMKSSGNETTSDIFAGKAYLRPLVRTHPETGRKMLLSSLHAFGVVGMEKGESVKLLDELVNIACQPPRVHTQKWTPGEMMFWDQRRCFHRALPYTGKRRIRSLRLKGDPTDPYDLALPEPRDPEGVQAVRDEVEWLLKTKPWENPEKESLRGGIHVAA